MLMLAAASISSGQEYIGHNSISDNLVGGGDIEISVTVYNPTDHEINIRVYLISLPDETRLAYGPTVGWMNIGSGHYNTILFRSSDDPGWDLHSLGESYRIQVEQQGGGVLDRLIRCTPGACRQPTCDQIVDYVNSAMSEVTGGGSSYLTSYVVMGVIKAESTFRQCSGGEILTSEDGALGLMQLIPSTATQVGVDPCVGEMNVLGGTKYLNWLLTSMNYRDYETPIEFTLAAYNWGPGRVDDAIEDHCPGIWSDPPTMSKRECGYGDEVPTNLFPSETRVYVSRITGWLSETPPDISCEGILPEPTPSPTPPTPTPTTERGYIVSVTHKLVDGDEITITVRIRNPTSEEINVRAYVLRGSDDEEMEHEPNNWLSIRPGGRATITLTSTGDPDWDVHSLGGSYKIRVDDRDKGEMDISGIKYVTTAPTGVYPEECVCDCNGRILHLVSQEGNCELTCARACGTHTNCVSNCESCCATWCSGKGDECVEACLERCQLTSSVNELIESIKSAAIIIAAIIFILCSIQYLIAGNPESRDWAKKCITYVVIGLIILGLALYIVELLDGMVEPGVENCVRTASCDTLCEGEGYSNDGGGTCYNNSDCTIKCFGDCVPTESCDDDCGGAGYSNDGGRTCYKDVNCNIVCPEKPEFNGPIPFDDRCTIWECVDSTQASYCEKWDRTETGWVCTEPGVVASFCNEWSEESNGWLCVDAREIDAIHGACEQWNRITDGWRCEDDTIAFYCEEWDIKAFENGWGWECTNVGTWASYCERWEQSESKDKWSCTNGGYLSGSCKKWRCVGGVGDIEVSVKVDLIKP